MEATQSGRQLVHEVPVSGDVVGEHPCPACGATVPQVFRAGRARIYCANACRQRAYRWRRSNGVRLCVERNGPTEMLHNEVNHARRDDRDPASELRDHRRRELAVCGTFARPLRDMRRTHYDFVPEFVDSCDRCRALIGAGPDGTGIPDIVRPYLSPLPRSQQTRSSKRSSRSNRRRPHD